MIKHYIIMSSSYTAGTRIALDITDAKLLNSQTLEKIIHEIKSRCGSDIPLSTHLIETGSESWDSVKEYDPFFEGVDCVKSLSVFLDRIQQGRLLSGLDVAKYILTKRKCTHLSLEKLVYLAYAEYLCNYSDRLFEDKIYAFSYGPVVESVYETYKRSGYNQLVPYSSDKNIRTDVKELPAKSRILFAKNGATKLHSIDQTIEKYGKYSAYTLVAITHREGSPWSKVDSTKSYEEIPDDFIRAYHYAERE